MQKVPCDPSLGADVEYFLYNTDTCEIEPACGLVGGTKENPLPLGDGYAVQEDNVMVEWNIPPATRWDRFYYNIDTAKELVNAHVTDVVGDKYTTRCLTECTFSSKVLLASDQAQTFGCEPDFDAYLGGVQRRDGAVEVLGNTRSCGGHIHLGGDFQCPDFVAALFAELFIGVFGKLPMNFYSARQKWYGQPGIFRPKPYGIEYRTPDSMWTSETDTIENVATYGLQCAEFLTRRSANELQTIFRAFPWVELRRYMSGETRTAKTRTSLLGYARELGITA